MFYALDGLLDAASESQSAKVYLDLVHKDLDRLVQLVVPPTKEGILNLLAAQQILKSWKTRRVVDPATIESVEELLRLQKTRYMPSLFNTAVGLTPDQRLTEHNKRNRMVKQELLKRSTSLQSSLETTFSDVSKTTASA